MSFGPQNFVFLVCISSQIRVSFAVSSSDGYDLQRGTDDEFRNIECDWKQSRCTIEQCERQNAKCSDNSFRVCRCPNRGTYLVFPNMAGTCSKDEDLVNAFGKKKYGQTVLFYKLSMHVIKYMSSQMLSKGEIPSQLRIQVCQLGNVQS